MGVITLATFLLLSSSCYCYAQRVIYVDSSSQTGVNDSFCWEGGYSTPCLSLNLALKGAQHYSHSITILLQPGQHQLHNGSETRLRNLSQLAIVGNTSSEGEVVINCQPLSGLAFLRSSNVTMKNLKIIGCGTLQYSIGKRTHKVSLSRQSAIFYNTCKNIQLVNVDVIKSNGTGAIIHNPLGVVKLNSCKFLSNKFPPELPPMYAGGGGLVIEAHDVISQSFCTITNSNFFKNTAKSSRLLISSEATNPVPSYESLDLGGGISVVFSGGTTNNIVQLNQVRLENNRAQFGGGLFLAFYDNSSNNTIIVDKMIVTKNTAMLEVGILLPFASGGGILIDFAASQYHYPFNNTVEISNSIFLSNTAQLGGGIAVDVVYDGHGCVNADNKLLIENCSFDNNEGYQGSSAYFLGTSKDCRAVLNATLSFSSFTNNRNCTKDKVLPCLGSVLLRRFPLTLNGNSFFSGNAQSALGLTASSIKLLPSAQLQFTNNNGFNGAALHIVDCSSVIVNDNTSLYFENNNASNHGDAIYSEACSQTKGECFIKHNNLSLEPDEWNVSVIFNNSGDSLIYMDSIKSCVWPKYSKNTTFCWKGWNFRSTSKRDSCHKYLRSGPAFLTNNANRTKYTVYPGECINLEDFSVFDDFSNDITSETNLQVSVLSGDIETVTKLQEPNCECTNLIPPDTCSDRSYYRRCQPHEFVVKSLICSEGYNNGSSLILIHPSNQSYGIVLDLSLKTCNNGSTCNATSGYCFKHDSPFAYKAACNASDTTNDCKEKIICGSCVSATDGDKKPESNAGFAINLPSLTCISCENAAGVGYYLLTILLVMIMMTILAVLHINITNGNLNAYILYSQMVTLQFPGYGFTAWIPTSYSFVVSPLIVYSIWNLNFLTLVPLPFCIPSIRTAVGVILLQYVTAACPLLFIIVSYTWIQCYNNGYRLVVYTTRPVHRLLARFWQKFKIKPSLIDTYAGLLLLAYMRFLAVSVKLLQITLTDHLAPSPSLFSIALVIIPILCLLVFVILPMAVLLLYPFKIFQQCLTCCRLDRPGLHALVDAYQGCFKNSATDGTERRYFAGFCLLFQFCYVVIFVSSIPDLEYDPMITIPILGASFSFVFAGLVLILRPYKKTGHNVIEFLTLFLMAILAVLSVINITDYILLGSLMYLPFLVLVCYLIYRVFKLCCAHVTHKVRKSTHKKVISPLPSKDKEQPLLDSSPKLIKSTEVSMDEYIQDDLYADRILNPSSYK